MINLINHFFCYSIFDAVASRATCNAVANKISFRVIYSVNAIVGKFAVRVFRFANCAWFDPAIKTVFLGYFQELPKRYSERYVSFFAVPSISFKNYIASGLSLAKSTISVAGMSLLISEFSIAAAGYRSPLLKAANPNLFLNPAFANRYTKIVVRIFRIAPRYIDDHHAAVGLAFVFIFRLLSNHSNQSVNKADNEVHLLAAEFEKWDKAGGKVMAGLLRRRLAEKTEFLGQPTGA
jgi:hypothetical protein